MTSTPNDQALGDGSDKQVVDYSCFVTVVNRSHYNLTLKYKDNVYGDWAEYPSANIRPDDSNSFQLRDNALSPGADGVVRYLVENGPDEISAYFRCPVLTRNEAYWNGTPSKVKLLKPEYNESGHPLHVNFIVLNAY